MELGGGADPDGIDLWVRDDVHRISGRVRHVVLRRRGLIDIERHRFFRGLLGFNIYM